MKMKERLYAVIGGCVGAFITMLMWSYNPLGAQSGEDGNFNVVTCRELKVLDSGGKRNVRISSQEYGGSIAVYGDTGAALLVIDKRGGRITVAGDRGSAWMSIGGHGGFVSVFGQKGEGHGAVMSINKHGGEVRVVSDQKRKAIMGVNEDGNGTVTTWDKAGNLAAELK